MVQDHLSEAVLRRFEELGLPRTLLDVGQFRENFLENQWVMLVRDGDDVATVHLIQPRQQAKPSNRR